MVRAALPEVPQLSRPVITSFRNSDTNDQYAGALARIAYRATRTSRPLPADERTVLDLITALTAGGTRAPATAHRAAARFYMEEHLTDPSLGAEQVAAAIGISERQLSRVFAADGVSIPRHVLSRRLHLAYSMLSSAVAAEKAETVADMPPDAALRQRRISPTPSAGTLVTARATSGVSPARKATLEESVQKANSK